MLNFWNKWKKVIIGTSIIIGCAIIVKYQPLFTTTIPCIISFICGGIAMKLWDDKHNN